MVFAMGGYIPYQFAYNEGVLGRMLFFIGSVAAAQSWQLQESGTTAGLRGISAVSDRAAWASGTKGTILRTVDGGETWRSAGPVAVADLDFRDVEGLSDLVAIAMSAGPGRASRLYKTIDGGVNWMLLKTNQELDGFWDSIAMWDATHGILMGDPVKGRFTILTTADGVNWIEREGPKAEKDEAAFAASGTSLAVRGTREAWFATGGAGGGRVFHSEDAGKTWTVVKTSLRPAGEGAGIFSLAMAGVRGVAVGGDYKKADEAAGNIVVTSDGGGKWTVPPSAPGGYRSAVAYLSARKMWIAVGTSGSDVSSDDGRTWRGFDAGAFNALGVA
ncbi:MAG: oxidoreductase, partial [Acidobacteriota bacterium]